MFGGRTVQQLVAWDRRVLPSKRVVDLSAGHKKALLWIGLAAIPLVIALAVELTIVDGPRELADLIFTAVASAFVNVAIWRVRHRRKTAPARPRVTET